MTLISNARTNSRFINLQDGFREKKIVWHDSEPSYQQAQQLVHYKFLHFMSMEKKHENKTQLDAPIEV